MCCGQRRAAMAGHAEGVAEEWETVWFSYAGVQTIVVKGSITGRTYRFSPGGWLRVNGSDAPSMRDIPGLKRRDGPSG